MLPRDWILAVGPVEPGAAEALAALAAAGPGCRVLLTGRGLGWLSELEARERLAALGADLALCSRSARDAGLSAAGTPQGAAWSSLARFLVAAAGRPLGTLLP